MNNHEEGLFKYLPPAKAVQAYQGYREAMREALLMAVKVTAANATLAFVVFSLMRLFVVVPSWPYTIAVLAVVVLNYWLSWNSPWWDPRAWPEVLSILPLAITLYMSALPIY